MGSDYEKFFELIKESVIVQASCAFIIIGSICIMAAKGDDIPVWLLNMAYIILGFYFGSKVENIKNKRG